MAAAFLNPSADLFRRRAFSVPAPVFPASRVPAGPPVSGYGGFGATAGPILRALTAHRAQHTPVAGLPVPVPPPDAVLRSGAPETTGATGTTGAWEAVPALGLDPVLRRDERALAGLGTPSPSQGGQPGLGIASGFGLLGLAARAGLGVPGLGFNLGFGPLGFGPLGFWLARLRRGAQPSLGGGMPAPSSAFGGAPALYPGDDIVFPAGPPGLGGAV